MKRAILIIALISLFLCNKQKTSYPNKNLIVDTNWLVVSESMNGIKDTSNASAQQTLNFRSDGKMYFKQVSPFILDTVRYDFVDNNNIRVTKPWANYPVTINYSITLLDASHFEFTSTSRQGIYVYKMIRQ
jgi:hypothetical protein